MCIFLPCQISDPHVSYFCLLNGPFATAPASISWTASLSTNVVGTHWEHSPGALNRSIHQEHSPGALTAAPPRRVQLTALSLKLFQSEASIWHIRLLIYSHLPSVAGRFLTLVPGICENVRFHGEVEDQGSHQLALNTPMGTKLITGSS